MWISIVIAVIVGLFSTAFDQLWARLLVMGIAVAVMVAFLAWLGNMSADADRRRRSALSWLHAYEDAIATERRGWRCR